MMYLGIDYPTWWFLVVGALFSGYAILDGFDFGAGAWHLLFKTDLDRKTALNAVGPVWDGNEVWLVIGGGALFAGFPVLYATLLSAMYIPFMLLLTFIILRAVAIEFRGKEPMAWWRQLWDITYSVSSIIIGFLLGVVLGNVLQGIAVADEYLYTGNGFLEFLNPFAVLVGLTSLALFMMHGAIFLLLKTEGQLFEQIVGLLNRAMVFFVSVFVITTLYTFVFVPHLADNFFDKFYLVLVPINVFLSIANVPRLASKKKYLQAFLFSSLTISLLLMLAAIEVYPNLLLSSVDPSYHLTIYNASSSGKSLQIMLTITAIGAPLVIGYTIFVYRTFWGKVKLDETSY